MKLVTSGLPYILHGLHPQEPKIYEGIMALRSAFTDLIGMTSEADVEDRGRLDALRMRTIEAVCLFERAAPLVCRALQVHILVHLPNTIHRWNSLKNCWQFFGERYTYSHTYKLDIHCPSKIILFLCLNRQVGRLIRYVRNRDLAVENIMTALVRQQFLLTGPPQELRTSDLYQKYRYTTLCIFFYLIRSMNSRTCIYIYIYI